jgi:hypothetical protein
MKRALYDERQVLKVVKYMFSSTVLPTQLSALKARGLKALRGRNRRR